MQPERLGPYRLGKLIGKGGMGTVYEAVDVESGQAAAVKVLSPSLASDEGFRTRFESEIESLKKLRHPNIVRLYGYGEQSGTLFYAMELVHGTSLEEEICNGRRFDWREVTEIAIKLCRALKLAHDHGVIHRDMKPANVMLATDGEVKLSDFGIARLFGNTRLTGDGGVLGTAEYMAPEQASGGHVTERCDQYSLGGLMYTLLAGRAPFRAKTLVEMLQLQRYADPDPVTRYAPDTPDELARIIHQLLEKEPQKRFANTMMLARSLEAMERGLSVATHRGRDLIAEPPQRPASEYVGRSSQSPTLSPDELAALNNPDRPPDAEATAATMAHGQYVERSESDEQEASPASDRYTKVDSRQSVTDQPTEEPSGFFSAQTFVLAAALAMLLAIGWYAMQPPSANRLYQDIEAASADGDIDQMKAALPSIELFLKHYADDPRAEQVQTLQAEATQSHPAQRAYTEAKRLAILSPELAAAKFQALIDVFDDPENPDEVPGSVRHFIKLARIKLHSIQKQIAQRVAVDREALEGRLARADELADENPAAARRIYQGVITLYTEKPWANGLVEQARAQLDRINDSQAAAN